MPSLLRLMGVAFVGVLCAFSLTSVSPAEAGGCEKWKSEFLSGAVTLTSYINTHRKYFDKKIGAAEFDEQALNLVAKLMVLEARAKAVPSCPHPDDKFEGRRRVLLQTLAVVIPLMKAGDVVAPEIRDRLERDGAE